MIKLQKFGNLTLIPMPGAHMPLILQTGNLDELVEVQQGWDLDYRILDTGRFRVVGRTRRRRRVQPGVDSGLKKWSKLCI